MIKSIVVLKRVIPLIKSGKKTVTRRVKFTGNPGDILYFRAGRFGKKEGYIKICNVMKVRLKDIRGDIRELEREGFYDGYPECFTRFVCLWDYLNNKKGYKWEDNPEVYRIEFEYLGESLNIRWLIIINFIRRRINNDHIQGNN